MTRAIFIWGTLAMATEAADFTYVALEGFGGESFRMEATLASRKITLQRREAAQTGGPIGLFEYNAPPGAIEKLISLTQALPSKPVSMRPDTPAAAILLNGGKSSWTLPRPSPEWDQHAPLRTEVLRLAGEAEKHPVRAMQVRLAEVRASEIVVELSNPGAQAVELNWNKVRIRAEGFIEMSKLPADPKGPAPLPPTNVTVGEYRGAATDAAKRIEPRGKLTVKVPVHFPKPGAWKLQARYECLSLPDASKGIEGRATSGAPLAAK